MLVGWLWLVLACILFGAFLLYKRLVLLAIGVAALSVSLLLAVVAVSDLLQVTLFGFVFGVCYLFVNHKNRPNLGLNNPNPKLASELLGTKTSILNPVVGGLGKVQIQDCLWTVTSSQDIGAGQLVEVVGFTGDRLHVNPVE